jgi:hypothetical protein
MLAGVQPFTSAPHSTRPQLHELRIRWGIWRFRRTLWRFFARWQLRGLFLLNRALRLARAAWLAAKYAKFHDQALEQRARLLLLQGRGTAALRELSRTWSRNRTRPASSRRRSSSSSASKRLGTSRALRARERTAPLPPSRTPVRQHLPSTRGRCGCRWASRHPGCSRQPWGPCWPPCPWISSCPSGG